MPQPWSDDAIRHLDNKGRCYVILVVTAKYVLILLRADRLTDTA